MGEEPTSGLLATRSLQVTSTGHRASSIQDLLSEDWLQRFGADAYLALEQVCSASPNNFATKIAAHLREAACWPTQGFPSPKSLAKASNIVIPDDTALQGFLETGHYLDVRLAERRETCDFALRNGAKRFTLNSLVRLRCAGPDNSKLSTKLGGQEANYHFINHTASLSDVDKQEKMARALTKLYRHLSNQNRKDLKESASTLAADGCLHPAATLVRVDTGLWEVCPEPLASRLHKRLLDHKGVATLCRRFALDTWILEAAGRAAAGNIQDSEREALYRHLLSEGANLGRKALAAVRHAPVVLDQRGKWVAPADLAQLPASHAALLGAVVSAPAPALAKRVEFLRRLRIRRKLLADDFLRFAPTIGEDAAVASRFEDLLNKHQHLLTPKTIASLRSVPFLHSRTGSLLEPERLHLPTTANLACLGSDDPLVAGDNNSLYRRLRCRELPSSETLLGVVRRLKQSGVPPTRPEIFYPALVSALRAEKLPTTAHVDEPLLWVSGAYHTPRDTLVGSRIPRLFRVALPIFRGPDVTERAYDDLGASVHPRDHHWIIFFQSFAEKVRSAAEQNILRAAYQRRGQLGLPDGLTETTRCLLSRDGSLHSLQDLHSASFLEDDYPQLATALSEQGADIVFADMVEGNRPFFLALGLKRLSDACGIPRVEMGAAGAPPSWFRSTHESDILSRFRLEDFATALHEVAWTHQRQTPEFRAARTVDLRGRLAAISQIKFVANLERVYRIAGNHCRVAAEAAVISDRIALSPARNMFDLEQMIAYALAELSGATRLADARALAVAILPLLRCRTRTEMRAYLTRQGASPPEWSGVELDFTETDAEDQPDARAEDIVRQIVQLSSCAVRPPAS